MIRHVKRNKNQTRKDAGVISGEGGLINRPFSFQALQHIRMHAGLSRLVYESAYVSAMLAYLFGGSLKNTHRLAARALARGSASVFDCVLIVNGEIYG